MKRYLSYSWISSKVVLKQSSIEGSGLFAKNFIKEGEVVEIFGGKIFTAEEEAQGKMREHTGIMINNGLYLGLPNESAEKSIDEFTNHSCEPSCWLNDEVTLIARHDIYPGEEITMDYGTWFVEEGYTEITNCSCGSKLCRHNITGDDWKRKDLQERYKRHFSPFINNKIEKLKKYF